MSVYNCIQFLTLFILLVWLLVLLFNYLQPVGVEESESVPFFSPLSYLFERLFTVLEGASILLPILLFGLLLREIIHRLLTDSLLNFWKAMIGIIRFRRFLTQSQKLPISELDGQTQSENKVIARFNKAVNQSVLDVTNEQLKLFIKVPRNAQSQKILIEHEEQIKEHISSFYPDYTISTFERQKFNLWLIGTKRK